MSCPFTIQPTLFFVYSNRYEPKGEMNLLKYILIFFLLLNTISYHIFKIEAAASYQETAVTENLNIDAAGAVLIEQSTGKVLFEKNKDARLFPASTTKILTALVALENGDINEKVIVGNEVLVSPRGGSMAGLDLGEVISLRDLIIALMYPSGNDAGYTIAVHIGRKVSNDSLMPIDEAKNVFMNIMNERARTAGATNSNFTNPHGFHNDNHYTTPLDLALISRAAMQNEEFRQIAAGRLHEYPDWSSLHDQNEAESETRYWIARNRLINPNSEFYYEYATGIKTGWTTPAGPCLVSSATRGGLDLISVVLNSSRNGQWTDSIQMFEYGFANFEFHTLLNANQNMGSVQVENQILSENPMVGTVSAKGFSKLFRSSEIQNIKREIEWLYNCPNGSKRVVAPISKNQVLGKVTYSLNGETIFTSNLLSTRDLEKRTIINTIVYRVQDLSFLFQYVRIIALLLLLLLLFRVSVRFLKT